MTCVSAKQVNTSKSKSKIIMSCLYFMDILI